MDDNEFSIMFLFCNLETNQCFKLKLYSIIYIRDNVQVTKIITLKY